MRYYELTINTKEADSLLEKVASYLPNPPVKQQKSPFFLNLEFYTEPEKIQELEKALKANSLRYMILSKELRKEPKIRKRSLIKKLSFAKASKGSPRFAGEAGKKKKVDLEEVDKKLKEILDES